MTTAREEADLVVLGSGQGGVPLAVALAERGRRVVLFDSGPLGGTCINRGCTPSKSLLAAAHGAGRARAAGPLGVHAEVTVDGSAVFARVRRIRAQFERRHRQAAGRRPGSRSSAATPDSSANGRSKAAAAIIRGGVVVIDTGGRPAEPVLPGLSGTPYLTSDSFFDLVDVPRRLTVVGGGYIGLELGQGARRLGSDVTIVHRRTACSTAKSPTRPRVLQAALVADGVKLELGTKPASVSDGRRRDRGRPRERPQRHRGRAAHRDRASAPTRLRSTWRVRHRVHQAGYVDVDDYLQTACPKRLRDRRRRGSTRLHARLVGGPSAHPVYPRRRSTKTRRPRALLHDVHRTAARAHGHDLAQARAKRNRCHARSPCRSATSRERSSGTSSPASSGSSSTATTRSSERRLPATRPGN